MKGRAAAMEAATPAAVKAASTATMAATAMAATDFGRQPVGGVFRRGHSARVDQRKRLRRAGWLRPIAPASRQPQGPGNGRGRARDLESSSCVKPPRMGDEG
jgi:hypothetical protein